MSPNSTSMRCIKLFLSFLFLTIYSSTSGQEIQFTMEPIGPNNFLDRPWDIHYGPEGLLWVTERERGILLRVDPETAARDELIQIPDHSSTASQDGLLGFALHEGFTQDSPYVYLSYTYLAEGPRQKLVRYTYESDDGDGSLSAPMTLIDNLPASNDHNSGRLVFGPDSKLYYTIGDQGSNQNRNYCNPVLSQALPTQEEVQQQDWSNYPGKILRLNTDGSIPEDNPELNGVRSHVFSYGHRNPQGIVFGSNGLLYSDEHGPDTDDEVNIIYSGKNYGWPNVVGFRDDQAYDYCNWSSVQNCADLDYDKNNCPANAAFNEESEFMADNYQEPLASMFAVTDDYDFNDPKCSSSWICRPNVAPSSIGIYESEAIPGWKNSLLVISLKRGQVFRYQLDETGTMVLGDTTRHMYTPNRYRDIAIHPDGKTFYLLVDAGGRTSGPTGLTQASGLANPGNILKFTAAEPVSVKGSAPDAPFRIFPNPVRQLLTIDLETNGVKTYRGTIIDARGRVVRSLPPLSGRHEVSVGDLPAGLYFVRISSASYTWQEKVVVL